MKWTFLVFLVFLFSDICSQTDDKLQAPEVSVGGHKSGASIDIALLRSGFRVELSDTNFQVERFVFTWDNSKGTIYEMISEGDSINFLGRPISMNEIRPKSAVFVDNIRAIYKPTGRRMKLPSLVFYTNSGEPPPPFKEITVCHDEKRRPVCYSDKLFRLDFEGKRFEGWSIDDSLVWYSENKKILFLNDKYLGRDSGVSIRLKDTSVIVTYAGMDISLENMDAGNKSLGRFSFFVKKGQFADTLAFDIFDHAFTIRISKWSYKNREPWNWEIVDWYHNTYFFSKNHWKHQRVGRIMISDTLSGHEMLMSTSFRSNKRMWLLESRYVEHIPDHPHRFKRYVPDAPRFYYQYNRFGRVRKNRSTGEVKECGCG